MGMRRTRKKRGFGDRQKSFFIGSYDGTVEEVMEIIVVTYNSTLLSYSKWSLPCVNSRERINFHEL